MLMAFEASPGDTHWFYALQYLLSREVPETVRGIVGKAMANAIAEAIPQLTRAVYGVEFSPTAYTEDEEPVMSLAAAAASLGVSEEDLLLMMQAAEEDDQDDSYLVEPENLRTTQ
jgi:hypothetical protein